jgi:hypothetical protein
MPQPETRGKPVILFYSYSHRDEDLRNELAKHLTVLKRAGLIEETGLPQAGLSAPGHAFSMPPFPDAF